MQQQFYHLSLMRSKAHADSRAVPLVHDHSRARIGFDVTKQSDLKNKRQKKNRQPCCLPCLPISLPLRIRSRSIIFYATKKYRYFSSPLCCTYRDVAREAYGRTGRQANRQTARDSCTEVATQGSHEQSLPEGFRHVATPLMQDSLSVSPLSLSLSCMHWTFALRQATMG